MQQLDLFGNPIQEKGNLRNAYGVPPFTILDAKSGDWNARKSKWLNLGIKSEIGRDAKAFHTGNYGKYNGGNSPKTETSVFDPVLCEQMYRWYCPNGGQILDPFAGGSVRGIVAHYLGYHYTGIDIRQEQIESNREQATQILGDGNMPTWYVGDSNVLLDKITNKTFDLIFTCPPYANLEVYSDLQGDISNMEYNDFIFTFESIMRKCCKLLNKGGYAILVVGEIRDKKGNYYGFVPDTVKLMQRCTDMFFYNECIFATPIGTAAFRADNNMIRGKGKLVKVHQNILMFKKSS